MKTIFYFVLVLLAANSALSAQLDTYAPVMVEKSVHIDMQAAKIVPETQWAYGKDNTFRIILPAQPSAGEKGRIYTDSSLVRIGGYMGTEYEMEFYTTMGQANNPQRRNNEAFIILVLIRDRITAQPVEVYRIDRQANEKGWFSRFLLEGR